MEKELIINSTPTEVEIALLEDNHLVEIHRQKTNNHFTVGDIFVGTIKKLMPGLNAAFVDIGHKKDAFLHYTDLGPQLQSLAKFTKQSANKTINTGLLDHFTLEPEIIKTGKIDKVLKKRQHVLVQILKEPISTKGPRLSCEITIPGRFMVLSPFSNTVSVSKKLGNSEERKRLKLLVESIRPKGFGVIVRTAAEGKKVADLHEEMSQLIEKWQQIYTQLQNTTPPAKLVSELDKTSSILRDILSDSFNKIVVNDKPVHDNIKEFLNSVAPDKTKILKFHKPSKPIFEAYGIARQIKSSFGKTATMASGAYLVIEHTEAMHVIDVNSGPKMQKTDQESSAVSVNVESAKEIARQLRLRDIGGIIIIDFIDMKKPDHRGMLYRSMKDYMANDRAQHTILPLSKFGLMQITRQRTRPEIKIDTAELCPSCKGSGKVNATILQIDPIERDLNYILSSRPKTKLELHVHPFIHAYLKQGFPSIQHQWYFKNSKWVKVISKDEFALMEYKFFDKDGDEIRLG